MAVLAIDNKTSLLNYEQLVQLDGVEYLLRFQWLEREMAWYMQFLDQDGVELAVGVRIVVDYPFLRRFKDPRLPPGTLIALDTSLQRKEIEASDELGDRVKLVYITVDDEG
jgi:hypothetical protein